MLYRSLSYVIAISCGALSLLIGAYNLASIRLALAGQSSEWFTVVAYSMFMAILAVMAVSMFREARKNGAVPDGDAREGKGARIPEALNEKFAGYRAASDETKLTLLAEVDKTFGPDSPFPKDMKEGLMQFFDGEDCAAVRAKLTELLVKASNLAGSHSWYFVDPIVINFLKLRLYEETDRTTQSQILDALGGLLVFYDSPGGSINLAIGQELVSTLTTFYTKQTDENLRIAAFKALTKLWCLNLDVSETVVKNALSDRDDRIREMARTAIDYAAEP